MIYFINNFNSQENKLHGLNVDNYGHVLLVIVLFSFFLFLLSGNAFLVSFVSFRHCRGIFAHMSPSAESTAYVPNVFPLKIFTCVSKKM